MMRSKCRLRVIPAILLLVAVTAGAVEAQQRVPGDSAQAEIGRTLRAFYFNLAHGDWEAVTADILAAKVVAHRALPEALAAAHQEMRPCSIEKGPQIDRSAIVLAGEWALVLVPRCGLTVAGADEFRLIHFGQRWRFVSIDLFEEPLNLSAER
jgi:hypothetical protein